MIECNLHFAHLVVKEWPILWPPTDAVVSLLQYANNGVIEGNGSTTLARKHV